MGSFDRFRGKDPSPTTPEQLFAALTDAVTRGDGARFEALCREHCERIVESFGGWRKPSEAVRADPQKLQTYAQVLSHTAKFLDEALGCPEPWRMLTGADEPQRSPFVRWQDAHRRIQQRMSVLDYPGALALARALLDDLEPLTGTGRDEQEELTRGLLGQLLLQSGRPEEAIEHLRWTLERCQARGDREGVGIYLHALHEADRDLDRPSRWLVRLAEHMRAVGRDDDAAWYEQVHARFPEGEPRLRMIAVCEGRRYELDQAIPTGRIQLVFERNRQTLAPAREWTQRGRAHGSRGEFEEAIACFVAAAAADPHDPDCRNQHAFTAMLLDRPELALPLYEEVERLAPGWFHARTWRSLAQRQFDGQIPHEAVRLVDLLQDGGLPAEQRLEHASRAILQWPRMPELHLYRGQALADLGREDAEHAWLAGLEVSDAVPSTRSRLLLALGRLEETIAVEGANLLAVATATIQLRLRAQA